MLFSEEWCQTWTWSYVFHLQGGPSHWTPQNLAFFPVRTRKKRLSQILDTPDYSKCQNSSFTNVSTLREIRGTSILVQYIRGIMSQSGHSQMFGCPVECCRKATFQPNNLGKPGMSIFSPQGTILNQKKYQKFSVGGWTFMFKIGNLYGFSYDFANL